MRVRDVMTHEFPLREYGRALDTFNDPGSGAIKIIVRP
jgi:L-iditol 2-dehydrogenase